jgi:Tfp pilus assembly protein PilP
MTGCSDLLDRYGDKIPFLKTEEEAPKPTIHELSEDDPTKTSEPPGGGVPPGETPETVEGPGETPEGGPSGPEGQPPTGEGTETASPPEGGEAGAPAGDDTQPPTEVADTEPPADGGETQPPAGGEESTPPESGETATEGTPPAPETTPPGDGGEMVSDETPPTEAPPAETAPVIMDEVGMDIAMLTTGESTDGDETVSAEDFYYDTRERRDPFRPYTLKIEKTVEIPPEELTPLMKYKLSQLTLKAIIYDPEMGTGVAMVEDPYRKGFNLYVGTNVAEGRVVRITEDEVQVEISYFDFYGEEQTRIETLTLAGRQ